MSVSLNLGFVLYSYRPWGGLQRDFLRIAESCRERGHRIHVFTMDWQGEIPPGFSVRLNPVRFGLNHQRSRRFGRDFLGWREQQSFDCCIGFNRVPGLDIYFAADPCYLDRVQKNRSVIYRWLPRYRAFAKAENALFGTNSSTEIILLSAQQLDCFQQFYGTPRTRMHLLDAGLADDRRPVVITDGDRREIRRRLDVSDKDHLLLSVGSGFRTKGLARTLEAIAALPDDLRQRSKLRVIGEDRPVAYQKMASRLEISEQVRFLGGREDIMSLYACADMLLHPALSENTGAVILEAIVSGLPVIVTDNCGNAHHVVESGAGIVLSSPFSQRHFNRELEKLLSAPGVHKEMADNGRRYAALPGLYGFADVVTDVIVNKAKMRMQDGNTKC